MTLLDDDAESPLAQHTVDETFPPDVDHDGLLGGAGDDVVVEPVSSFGPPLPPPSTVVSPPRRRGSLVGAAALCIVLSAGVSYTTVRLTEHGNTGTVSVVAPAKGGSTTATNTATGTGTYDLHALLAKVEPAVAAIEVADGSSGTPTPVAAGSGVVISTSGLMVTNAHVVHAADQSGNVLSKPVFTVKMADGTVRSAKVLGASTAYDVALLQLEDTSNLTALPLADASSLQVGDPVVAIGNALDLGDAPTVTTGIISALDRTLQESASVTLRGLIQTDAAINHGNSGGALVNSSGQLIGINSAGITDAQNIGFAISVGTIAPLLDQLKAGNDVQAAPIGYIGVVLTETPNGITVATVQAGTPAADAGIKAGDVITKVNATPVSTANQLANVLQKLSPGTKVRVTVERDGATKVFDITLATRPTN